MALFIGLLWLVLSIIAICIDQYRWDGLYKLFIGSSILCFFLYGRFLYDPSAPTSYAVTIELNDTWTTALLVSFAGGACITGPFAAIHALQDWLYYDRNININPFRKTDASLKEDRKSLIDREKEIKDKRKQAEKERVNAIKLCRIADIIEVKQISYEDKTENRNYVSGTFSVTNRGKQPITDIAISKKLKLGKPGNQCIMDIVINDRIIEPGETIEVTTKNKYQYRYNRHRNESEYTYRAVGDDNDYIYKVNTIKRVAYIINPEQS